MKCITSLLAGSNLLGIATMKSLKVSISQLAKNSSGPVWKKKTQNQKKRLNIQRKKILISEKLFPWTTGLMHLM